MSLLRKKSRQRIPLPTNVSGFAPSENEKQVSPDLVVNISFTARGWRKSSSRSGVVQHPLLRLLLSNVHISTCEVDKALHGVSYSTQGEPGGGLEQESPMSEQSTAQDERITPAHSGAPAPVDEVLFMGFFPLNEKRCITNGDIHDLDLPFEALLRLFIPEPVPTR